MNVLDHAVEHIRRFSLRAHDGRGYDLQINMPRAIQREDRAPPSSPLSASALFQSAGTGRSRWRRDPSVSSVTLGGAVAGGGDVAWFSQHKEDP